MLNNKLFIAATLAALCTTTLACRPGRIDRKLVATEQAHGRLALPAPGDANAPLDLSGQELDVSYGGNLLLWNPAVTPAQIGAISDASVNGRLAKAEHMRFRKEVLAPLDAAVAEKAGEIDANTAAINTAVVNKRNSPEARALKIGLAAQWFDQSVTNLVADQALGEPQAAAARDTFKAYCEYKLYEFAVSRLAQFDYAQRPSPLEMCEGYYKDRGMFAADAPACRSAAELGQDRANYFACIWGDGVFRSQTFAALAASAGDGATCDKSGAKRADAFKAWLASGLLRRLAFDNDVKPIDNRTYAQLFEDALLGGKALNMTKISLKKAADGTPAYPDVKSCKAVVMRADLGAAVAGAAGWQQSELKDLKLIGESDAAQGTASKFSLFATGDGAAPEALAARQNLASKLRLYAERNTGQVQLGDGAVLDNVLVSADDGFFNQPVGATISANRENTDKAQIDPDLKRIFDVDENIKPLDLLEKNRELQAELAAAQAHRAAEDANGNLLFDKITDQNQNGIHSITSPGAVTLSRKLTLAIHAQVDRAEVRLSFGGVKIQVRGCVNLVEGAGFGCPSLDLAPELQVNIDSLAYDSGAGKLTLSIPLRDVAALGLGAVARQEDNPEFNDLADADLEGRALELDVYPNALNPYYEFVTGVARVKAADGKLEREGSFSADNFSQ